MTPREALRKICEQMEEDFDMEDDDRVSEALAQRYMEAKSILAKGRQPKQHKANRFTFHLDGVEQS